MYGLDAWDLALLAVAGYIAIMTLIRMIRRRRDVLVDNLMEQVHVEKTKLKAKKKKERRANARAKLRGHEAA